MAKVLSANEIASRRDEIASRAGETVAANWAQKETARLNRSEAARERFREQQLAGGWVQRRSIPQEVWNEFRSLSDNQKRFLAANRVIQAGGNRWDKPKTLRDFVSRNNRAVANLSPLEKEKRALDQLRFINFEFGNRSMPDARNVNVNWLEEFQTAYRMVDYDEFQLFVSSWSEEKREAYDDFYSNLTGWKPERTMDTVASSDLYEIKDQLLSFTKEVKDEDDVKRRVPVYEEDEIDEHLGTSGIGSVEDIIAENRELGADLQAEFERDLAAGEIDPDLIQSMIDAGQFTQSDLDATLERLNSPVDIVNVVNEPDDYDEFSAVAVPNWADYDPNDPDSFDLGDF